MDVITRLFRQTEEERRFVEEAVDSRRTLFSKWKLKVPKTEKKTDEVAAEVDVDPEILKRVDRALQLVSQFRPPPPKPASPPEPSRAPSQHSRPPSSRPTAAGDVGPPRGRPPPRRPANRPPLVARPPAVAHKPAHTTAPFKTDSRVNTALYRRSTAPKHAPTPRQPAQRDTTARLHSGRATSANTATTARRWMKEETFQQQGTRTRREERKSDERMDPAPCAGLEEEMPLPSKAVSPRQQERPDLRRSVSEESLASPRTPRIEEEKMEFDKFIRCVPIPSKLRREVRLSRSLLDKARHFLQTDSTSAQRFQQLVEDSNDSSRKAVMEHLSHQASEIERRFSVFQQVEKCIDLERASPEQVRWCWRWLWSTREQVSLFQLGFRRLAAAGTVPVLSGDDAVESFIESARGPCQPLTPEEVFRHVGGQRSTVLYKNGESLFRMVDLHSRLYKLQQTLEVAEGLAEGLGDLEKIVRRAENPATAFRQLNGLLVDRFPVMILDDG